MHDRSLTMLIVEDSSTIRFAYKRLLDKEYALTFAEDPLSALRQIVKIRPDVILLDINLKDGARQAENLKPMKKMDGLDICAAVKRSPFKETPVIMLTSRDGLVDKVRGRMAHADRYLTKPIDPDMLRSTLQDLLGGMAAVRRLKSNAYSASPYPELDVTSTSQGI